MAKLATSRRPGRPRIVPTADQRQLVIYMRFEGYTFYAMAKRVGVSIPTLKRAFERELFYYSPKVLAKLAAKSLDRAMAGHTPSMLMWLQRSPNWRTERVREPKPPKPGSMASDVARLNEMIRRGTGKLTVTLTFNEIPEIRERVAAKLREDAEKEAALLQPKD